MYVLVWLHLGSQSRKQLGQCYRRSSVAGLSAGTRNHQDAARLVMIAVERLLPNVAEVRPVSGESPLTGLASCLPYIVLWKVATWLSNGAATLRLEINRLEF
jgi:hypothetical protein